MDLLLFLLITNIVFKKIFDLGEDNESENKSETADSNDKAAEVDEKEEDAGEDAEEAKSKNEEEKEEQEEKDAEGSFLKELLSLLSTKMNNMIDH